MILVTGGAGFIGSHLVERLVRSEEQVVVIDDLSSGDVGNITAVRSDIKFYQARVEEFDFSLLRGITAVVHLAAQTSVPYSIDNYAESSKANLLSTIVIIDYCRKNHIPLVYATSSAVYGGLDYGDDALGTIDLISPYAVDKYVMELYAGCAAELYKLSSIGLRFFNVYGPRQDPSSPYSGVITVFIKQLLGNAQVTVNGGYQTRDFVYVDDVVTCIISAITKARAQSLCESINVLTGTSISIDSLVEKLVACISTNSTIKHGPLPIGDPEKSGGSLRKMQDILEVDVDDFVMLEEGLSHTIDFFNELSCEKIF
ncbi:MAG: NAD-dependent epimerase/dehydratase family protein [Gammaproteobacteria bacterium]|nr:NAD-dependent epimerase/dehydratase family protein [Gammaproteobacteria bacterium]